MDYSARQIRDERNEAYLKLECDFNNCADRAYFFYSLDGESWLPLGEQLQMTYTLPHFMGCRFALFYATKTAGGFVDFDYFRIGDEIRPR